MLERDVTVTNRLGLHARASAKLVHTVQRFKSNIMLLDDGHEVNAASIMGVMMLAARQGTCLKLRADGPDEESAVDEVAALFARGFDEGT